jgi:hypothetical protein
MNQFMKKCLFIFTLFIINNRILNAKTLPEVLQEAYKISDYIKIQDITTDIAKIDYQSDIASVMPELRYTYANRMNNTSFNGDQSLTMNPLLAQFSRESLVTDSTFSVRQNLSIHKMIPGLIYSNNSKKSRMYETEIAITNFGMMAVNLYLNIVYLERSIEVYNKLENIMQDRVKKLEVMAQYGIVKKDKLSLAQAQLMNIKSQKIKILSDLDIAKMEYTTTLQQEPEELIIPDVTNYKLPLDNKEDFVSKALINNYQLLKSNTDTKTSHALFITNTMNTMPDIGIEAGLKNTSIKTPLNNFNIDQQYIAFAVSIGLNTQANTISNARKTYKLYRINQLKHNLDIEKIKQDALATWNNYHSMLELIKAAKQSLEVSENALKEATIAVQSGLATTTDADEARQAVLEANLNLITAQKNAVMLYYKIHSMIGISNLSSI